MPSIFDRLKKGWNAFINNKDPSFGSERYYSRGYSSFDRPDRMRFKPGLERTMVSAIFNRIAVDAASVDIRHVRVDENDHYIEEIHSDLDYVLTTDANIDQTGRAMIQDAVQSLCDEGCVAIVPTIMEDDPEDTNSYKIQEIRVGKILEWYPDRIKVRLYNEMKGVKEDIYVMKKYTAIVENPLYTIMNGPNSTLQRLIKKLNLLDKVDSDQASGKLDLIIQLPYMVKTETRKKQAEERRQLIETQLTNSKYGVAYIDSTEHIVQLNRSLENNLWNQAKDLTSMLYSQLGLTEDIMNGTANEDAMTNYYARTIEPILSAITEEMKRKFLTKTAQTQGQSIKFFKDPFKLISTTNIASIADTFTRNAIMSSNEVRAIIGMKPSDQEGADDLRNKNINESNPNGRDDMSSFGGYGGGEDYEDDGTMSEADYYMALSDLDDLDAQLDELERGLDEE